MTAPKPVNKKRHFVAQGIFHAELNQLFRQELAEDGYSELELRIVPPLTEITIRATRTQSIFGDQGKRIRELTSLIQKRWKLQPNSVKLLADRLKNKALSATAQVESMIFKIKAGLPVRRAAYGILRFVKEQGGCGVEVRVAGKLRGQRAKAMKFSEGYMIKSGDPRRQMVDRAVRHLILEQGALGVCVKIMLPTKVQDENFGKEYVQPDVVTILNPKPEELQRHEATYDRIDYANAQPQQFNQAQPQIQQQQQQPPPPQQLQQPPQ